MKRFVLWLIKVFKLDIPTEKEIVKYKVINDHVEGDLEIDGDFVVKGSLTVKGGVTCYKEAGHVE